MNTYQGQYEKEINNAAFKYNVDPFLIASIIKQESNFNPNAKSSAGAKGLMQLMPGTLAELGAIFPFDPHENIYAGTKYIADRLLEFDGDVEKALAAYNCGSSNVYKFNGIPPFKETERYVETVLGYFEEYKNIEVQDSLVEILVNMQDRIEKLEQEVKGLKEKNSANTFVKEIARGLKYRGVKLS